MPKHHAIEQSLPGKTTIRLELDFTPCPGYVRQPLMTVRDTGTMSWKVLRHRGDVRRTVRFDEGGGERRHNIGVFAEAAPARADDGIARIGVEIDDRP